MQDPLSRSEQRTNQDGGRNDVKTGEGADERRRDDFC